MEPTTHPPKKGAPCKQHSCFQLPRVETDPKFLLPFSHFALCNPQCVFLFSPSALCRLELSGSAKAFPISDVSGENEGGQRGFVVPAKNSLLDSVS